jgi:peptidyl-prolyl cis-trans isomerase A (cyclophilin A)
MRVANILLIAAAFVAVTAPPLPAQSREVLVRVETSLGSIDLAIDVARAPITSGNFLKYVDGGFYDGGRFHRATRAENYKVNLPNRPLLEVIQADISQARAGDAFPPIPLERTSVTGLKHLNGTLSMARIGPDTARASFSICIGDQPSLDFAGARNADGQGFAAFGRVTAGMDVVKKIQASKTRAADAAGRGGYGTETLDPPIKVLRAYRK